MTLYICPICQHRIRDHTRDELLEHSKNAIDFVAHLQFLRLMYPDEKLYEKTEIKA